MPPQSASNQSVDQVDLGPGPFHLLLFIVNAVRGEPPCPMNVPGQNQFSDWGGKPHFLHRCDATEEKFFRQRFFCSKKISQPAARLYFSRAPTPPWGCACLGRHSKALP
eukprot:EG_transcript_7636